MTAKTISVKLKVWRQPAQDQPGRLVDYVANNVSTDMSFLEMLDVVNEDLIRKGEDAIAFDSDCREGICGSCGLMINGVAHGPDAGATTCQLHMRRFKDGERITVEPWRAKAFPILKDLTVDRRAFDRILAAGGYISAGVGGAPDGNALLIPEGHLRRGDGFGRLHRLRRVRRRVQERRGASLHQRQGHAPGAPASGAPRAEQRVVRMVDQMNAEGFGACSNEGECEAVCPKLIPISNIAKMVGSMPGRYGRVR